MRATVRKLVAFASKIAGKRYARVQRQNARSWGARVTRWDADCYAVPFFSGRHILCARRAK